MLPSFDLNKIKFSTDKATFEKAVDLYEKGKVKEFKGEFGGFSAQVEGGNLYHVAIEAKRFGYGSCDCYMGQNDYLCKHMIAVALYAVFKGKPLSEEDKKANFSPKCSGRSGELSEEELKVVRNSINEANRYIKAYTGPSRIWFDYQNSLSEGCNRLSTIVSELPVSLQAADLIVKLLLRLGRKLQTGGVDDSDGTVGGFIEEAVLVLQEFAKLDKTCIKSFKELAGVETCFGWEEPLLKIK